MGLSSAGAVSTLVKQEAVPIKVKAPKKDKLVFDLDKENWLKIKFLFISFTKIKDTKTPKTFRTHFLLLILL